MKTIRGFRSTLCTCNNWYDATPHNVVIRYSPDKQIIIPPTGTVIRGDNFSIDYLEHISSCGRGKVIPVRRYGTLHITALTSQTIDQILEDYDRLIVSQLILTLFHEEDKRLERIYAPNTIKHHGVRDDAGNIIAVKSLLKRQPQI